MTNIPLTISLILNSILATEQLPKNDKQSLFATLESLSYLKRKSCFFELNDPAFNVPELRYFQDTLQQIREKTGITDASAILDYSLPNDYINAIYLALDDNNRPEISKYAQRLFNLYESNVLGNIIFDTNKIIKSRSHCDVFVLSRSAQKEINDDVEYFVNVGAFEKEFDFLLPGCLKGLLESTDELTYVKELIGFNEVIKTKMEGNRFREILEKNCSSLVCQTILDTSPRNVAGISFNDVRSAFLTYLAFFLSITPSHIPEFDYFPVQMMTAPDGKLKWVGGILVPMRRESSREERLAFRSMAQIIVSSFHSAYSDGLLLESLKMAAQAQIMSRNMSHNLGSHVLARIKGSDLQVSPKQSDELLGYLQERMDFVARVATKWPAWREPVLFWGDLLHGFFKQTLLLNNLVADDGYTAEQIEFQIELPNNSGVISVKSKPSDESSRENKIFEFDLQEAGGTKDNEFSDLIVAIPGGPVGRQAFYGFLENAIRNGAKHNPGHKLLKVILKIDEFKDSTGKESAFYRFRYKDSVSVVEKDSLDNPESNLVERIRKHLRQDLVNPSTRKTVNEAWGIQEMKVYARYLAYPVPTERDPLIINQENFLWADEELLESVDEYKILANMSDAAEQTESTKPQVLTYSFGLQRPCLALIAGNYHLLGDIESFRRNGVEIWGEDLQKLDPKFIKEKSPGLLYVIHNSDENDLISWLDKNKLWLPQRVLIRTDSSNNLSEKLQQKGLFHRVRVTAETTPLICEETAPPHMPEEKDIQRCVVDIYRQWLIAVSEDRDLPFPFHLIIYFDRDGTSYPQRWAALKESVRKYGLADVVKVFPMSLKSETYPPSDNTIVLSEPWQVVNRFPSDAIEVESDLEKKTWLIFDNHGDARPDNVQTEFSQYLGGYSKNSLFPNNRDSFDRMMSFPSGFAGVISLIQIIEACLLKVLILDERVAGEVLQIGRSREDNSKQILGWRSRGNSLYGVSINNFLSNTGIHFVSLFNIINENQPRTLCVLPTENDSPVEIKLSDLVEITIENSKASGISWNDQTEPERLPFFDAVVIHKGLVERIGKYIGPTFDQNNFLESLHQLGARVIITSGRGAQMDGDLLKYPFVEFAVLENYVVRELSKVSFSNVLMAVMGGG